MHESDSRTSSYCDKSEAKEQIFYRLGAHALQFEVFGHVVVDGRRQGQVEEAVGLVSSRERQDVRVKLGEGALICIFPTDVRVPAEED